MTEQTTGQNTAVRYIAVAVLIAATFFGAYRFAVARSAQQSAAAEQAGALAAAPAAAAAQQAAGGSGGATSGAPSCACCSGGGATTANGVTGDPVEGAAKFSGGVQTITVAVGDTYAPNVLKLKAGIPARITFGQGNGSCSAQIVSQDLGFQADVTNGPKTVEVPALKPGTYAFSCSMGMVFGKVVVE